MSTADAQSRPGAPGPERLCQLAARHGYCWGILRHCYARVSRPRGAKVKWTKIGVYCERCGNFAPAVGFEPLRPGSRQPDERRV